MEICKWNSKNNNYNIRNNTSSKLIELRCENRDSFSNNVKKYEISTSKLNLPCSFVSKNVATDSLSNSVVNELDILPNLNLNKLQRFLTVHNNTKFGLNVIIIGNIHIGQRILTLVLWYQVCLM